jgi:hypothetical protein
VQFSKHANVSFAAKVFVSCSGRLRWHSPWQPVEKAASAAGNVVSHLHAMTRSIFVPARRALYVTRMAGVALPIHMFGICTGKSTGKILREKYCEPGKSRGRGQLFHPFLLSAFNCPGRYGGRNQGNRTGQERIWWQGVTIYGGKAANDQNNPCHEECHDEADAGQDRLTRIPVSHVCAPYQERVSDGHE